MNILASDNIGQQHAKCFVKYKHPQPNTTSRRTTNHSLIPDTSCRLLQHPPEAPRLQRRWQEPKPTLLAYSSPGPTNRPRLPTERRREHAILNPTLAF
eukprot:6217835-Amphidinium_carterae.1